MRLERLAIKGLSSAFPDGVELSLRDLPAGVIGVVGPNGQGKTMLLEATPGLLYRQLPARDGKDPVLYAIGRDSYIDEEFTVDGVGTFRARLNLDGPKRQSDAVLEAVLADGTRAPLNDGKRSTYDAVIAERFPSFDLFINSAFAAQGRGDEFTRRKPSQRKDLFAEFLALQHYATKAKAAAEAADLYADARLRLTAVIEQLERETAPAHREALDQQAHELQVRGGTADVRQRELADQIGDLEARLALVADQVAANTAAAERVRQLTTERSLRERDRAAADAQRQETIHTLAIDLARITTKRDATIAGIDAQDGRERLRIGQTRDAEIAEIDKRVAGNQQILGMAADIRAAIANLAAIETELTRLRADLSERQAERRQADHDVRQTEQAIAALVPVEDRLTRATRDASLLSSVPCGGAGEYAACQFLTDAAAARDQIARLTADLEPKAALADRLAAALRTLERLTTATEAIEVRIAACGAQQVDAQRLTKYEAPLAQATAKIESYHAARVKAQVDADQRLAHTDEATTAARAKAHADADEQLAEAQARHDRRLAELDAQLVTLNGQITTLSVSLEAAIADQARTAAGNAEATQLQAELVAARRDRDTMIATIAAAENGRHELERRRQELQAKRARLDELTDRRARIEQDWLEWRDLAKALGKGGLPDLEIDQAGPEISATTNLILLDCYGARFSIELVTQIQKADGSGFKDEFTVRVMDNERAGGWRDISDLSGGQKVIVQEALMCAIAIYVNERSSMPIRTLWRDETGAALDPDHAVRYVQMLRQVRALGGFHHVFFISHNAAAAALADAQIQVGDGRAAIVHPPYEVAA